MFKGIVHIKEKFQHQNIEMMQHTNQQSFRIAFHLTGTRRSELVLYFQVFTSSELWEFC